MNKDTDKINFTRLMGAAFAFQIPEHDLEYGYRY
jgi:hypothetical protein